MPICSAWARISSRPNAVTITMRGLVLQAGVAFDDRAGLQAIHARHVPVHQDQLIGVLRIGRSQFPDRFFPGRHRVGAQGKSSHRIAQDLASLRIVVDDQGADAGQVGDEPLALRVRPTRRRTRP